MSVIIYQEHIELLEEENEDLKREILILRKQLAYNKKGSQLLTKSVSPHKNS